MNWCSIFNSSSSLILTFQPFEPPVRSNSFYNDWRNPIYYAQEMDISIPEGEFLLKATVSNESENEIGEKFPSYFPLKVLAQASATPDYQLSLKLKKRLFDFKIQIHKFENDVAKPIKLFISQVKEAIDYPDKKIRCPKEELLKAYRVEKAKIQDNKMRASMFETIFEEGKKQDSDDENTFAKRYALGPYMTNGGQGEIYHLSDLANQAKRILKISRARINKYLLPSLKYISQKGLSPHLTAIYAWFTTTFEKHHPLGILSPVDANVTMKGYIMEKLDGDLTKLSTEEYKKNNMIFQIQIAATLHLLETLKIEAADLKARNILYKKLDETDLYKEQKLINYDYWKYKIETHTFYLPRPLYLIKLADFDSWDVKMFNPYAPKGRLLEWSDPLFQEPEKFATIFPKPDIDESKIIQIYP